MEDSIVNIASNFAAIVLALPVVMLGTWLATKNRVFYILVVAGNTWMAYVIFGMVADLLVSPEVTTSIKILTGSLPLIFFIVLILGAIIVVESIRQEEEK